MFIFWKSVIHVRVCILVVLSKFSEPCFTLKLNKELISHCKRNPYHPQSCNVYFVCNSKLERVYCNLVSDLYWTSKDSLIFDRVKHLNTVCILFVYILMSFKIEAIVLYLSVWNLCKFAFFIIFSLLPLTSMN